MAIENTSNERIRELVEKQRAFFDTGATLDVKWRVKQSSRNRPEGSAW